MGFVAICVTAGVSRPREEAGTDSVVVVEVSRTVEDGASCSDDGTDDDRRSIVVTSTVKAAGAYRG
jgi:hypothetical protein